MLRHTNTREPAHAILRHVVNAQAHTLQLQHELANEQRGLVHTSAGVELGRLPKDQADRHEEQRTVEGDTEGYGRSYACQGRRVTERTPAKLSEMRRNAERKWLRKLPLRGRGQRAGGGSEQEHLRNLGEHVRPERKLIAARDD
ncbi:hypothetical protein EDD15DRAFT_1116834 [Pisolithus albus]|nr:hypothetical protein EDD15DRAFT_1116834 [Pisolithus albus]